MSAKTTRDFEATRPSESASAGAPGRSRDDRIRSGLLSSSEVADWLGIAPRTVCLWAELQEIPAFKLGHQWRFRESDLLMWLQSQDLDKTARHWP